MGPGGSRTRELLEALLVLCRPSQVCVLIGLLAGGFRKEIAECPDDAEQTQPGVRVDCTAGLWFQNKKIAECLAEAVET